LSPGIITRSYTFPFLDANVTVMANVSVAVYDGHITGSSMLSLNRVTRFIC
jgi:hypothetical protein